MFLYNIHWADNKFRRVTITRNILYLRLSPNDHLNIVYGMVIAKAMQYKNV